MRERPGLLAIDLDGTLIDTTLTIRPRVREAVRSAQAAGVIVTIVTGRMFVATAPFARMLDVQAPVVCYQGAALFDAVSGSLLEETPLPNDVALEVYTYAKPAGFHIQVYKDDRFYAEEDNAYSRLYARLAGVGPTIVPSLPQALAGRDPTKLNIVTEPERTGPLDAALRERFGERAFVTRSNPEFVELMGPRVTKGRALFRVAELVGVPAERTLAIGDSYNDVAMLEAAGFGVAMGSSPAQLKSVADAVVADYENDGVAEAIERFVLGRAAAAP